MDELDLFWERHFGVPASGFERRLLAQVMMTIEPGDPVFVLAAMLTRQMYISLGENEKALLQFGPVWSKRMEDLEGLAQRVSTDLKAIMRDVRQLERSCGMLNARLLDAARTIPQQMKERVTTMLDHEYRTTLLWVTGLSLAFIAGVVAVTIFTP